MNRTWDGEQVVLGLKQSIARRAHRARDLGMLRVRGYRRAVCVWPVSADCLFMNNYAAKCRPRAHCLRHEILSADMHVNKRCILGTIKSNGGRQDYRTAAVCRK